MQNPVAIANFQIGQGSPLALIAGPDVIESPELVHETAEELARICGEIGLSLIFKCSYDKANRTSVDSFRGPGLERGLEILADVKTKLGIPILTDIHEASQAAPVAEVADVIQVPAFLCRQTDLVAAVAKTGKVVNIKKGQFVAPGDTRHIVQKCERCGNDKVLLTERGHTFGYNNLVVDMRAIPMMQTETGCPVVYDATHSVQLPSAAAGQSGGTREFIPHLARAAVAAGADAVFMEVHPEPEKALCDGAVSWRLSELPALLRSLSAIHAALRQSGTSGGSQASKAEVNR